MITTTEEQVILKPSKLKKGDTVIEVLPYNHHRNCPRYAFRGTTKIQEDIYRTTNWVIHSIGKKVMRLMDDKGMAKRHVNIAPNDKFYGAFVATEQDAGMLAQEWHLNDPHATMTYTVEYKRFIR